MWLNLLIMVYVCCIYVSGSKKVFFYIKYESEIIFIDF